MGSAPVNYDGLYIGGEWVTPTSQEKEEIINPATQEVIGLAPVGGVKEVSAALDAATDAFQNGPWPRMSAKERAAKMQEFHDALMARAEDIQELIIAEAGATRMLAQTLQFYTPMEHMQFFIDASLRNQSTSLPVEVTPSLMGAKLLGGGVTVREPVGVVSAITPYNFPYFMNISKIAPALAMGNTVVLKPSPFTPFEALIIAQIAHDIGLPAGVLNVVTGGTDVGRALTDDDRIDMVTFTGSDLVGASIMGQSAPTLKRLLLELGGKSALIIRPDANLQQAAFSGLIGFTLHCGQGCALSTRHIVHNSIRDEYVALLSNMVQQVKVGDPSDPQTAMGPLIRESQRERVEHYVGLGLESGAELVVGGKRPEGLEKGFFYEPTLFNHVDNASALAQEEVFGPVAVVMGFDTDEEAVRLANDSPYGLAGEIYSADAGTAYEMALQIRTGIIHINGGAGKMSSYAPYGGFKRSGIGREYGYEGLEAYTELKTITFHAG